MPTPEEKARQKIDQLLSQAGWVVQYLKSNVIDKDAKVVITTIQRLYAMLRGEEMAPEAEEISAFERALDGPPKDVVYTPTVPIETFDVIVTDECHRSIYGQWRQVLDYFDAFVIGLTATPSLHTLGFSNRNRVWSYAHVLRRQSVPFGDDIEQITYLLFLKMDEEREELLGERSAIPDLHRWHCLKTFDGDELGARRSRRFRCPLPRR